LEGLDEQTCLIDDILIHGKDEEEHNVLMHKVLEKLQEAGVQRCVWCEYREGTDCSAISRESALKQHICEETITVITITSASLASR